MNDPYTPNTDPKPKRKRTKPTVPRAPRTIDPGVAEIRKKASAEIKEYHKSQRSERLLLMILGKLDQLVRRDQEKLFDQLKSMVTPALITMTDLNAVAKE